MKSCVDSVKKYGWLFVFIFLLYPLAKFGEFFWTHLAAKAFLIIERVSKENQHSLQLLQALAILGIIFSWWKWKREENEKEERNLSSISFVDVDDNAVATIQNTSSSSILVIRVCRPDNFGQSEGNKTFSEYVADSEEKYREMTSFLLDTSNWKSIQWENILTAELFINEKAIFHIKDVRDEDGALVHFAPIQIEICLKGNGFEPKMKRVLFRYVSKNFQNSEGLGKDKYHPYGKWVRLR